MQFVVLIVTSCVLLGFVLVGHARGWGLPRPNDERPSADSWLARGTAILVTALYAVIWVWVGGMCSENCASTGNPLLMLPYVASPLLFWAAPKFWRWFGPGRQP